jgi:hypothetical protein
MQQPAYEYTRLSALTPRARAANFYAVVREYTRSKPTQGTDHMVSLQVCDETGSLAINAFAPGDDALPRVRQAGDVIRAHRVEICEWFDAKSGETRVQGVMKLKKGAAFVLVDGEAAAAGAPVVYMSSGANPSPLDEARVAELRRWFRSEAAAAQASCGPSGAVTYLKRISDLNGQGFFDAICFVVFNDAAQRALFVWDSTESHLVWSPPPPLEGHALPRRPRRGTLLPLRYAAGLREGIAREGDWIHVRNASQKYEEGAFCAFFNHNTQVSRLASDDARIRHLRELLDSELADAPRSGPAAEAVAAPVPAASHTFTRAAPTPQPLPPLPAWPPQEPQLATVITALRDAPLTPLRAVGAYPLVPARFRVRARLASVQPEEVAAAVVAVCPHCRASGPLPPPGRRPMCPAGCGLEARLAFSMLLTLADASGSLHAHLADDSARALLGLAPCDLRANAVARETLARLLRRLRGGDECLECCLESFRPSELPRAAFAIVATELAPRLVPK